MIHANVLFETPQNKATDYGSKDKGELYTYRVTVRETVLYVKTEKKIKIDLIRDAVKAGRREIELALEKDPRIMTSLEPLWNTYNGVCYTTSGVIGKMIEASALSGVGPMAAVAGAIADYVGVRIGRIAGGVFVENGGDIYLSMKKGIKVGIYAGESPFTGVYILLRGKQSGIGVCTSSGVVGHSFSFGKANSVTVVARTATIADAFATQLCNMVSEVEDVGFVVDIAAHIPDIMGIVVILDSYIGIWGDIEIGRD